VNTNPPSGSLDSGQMVCVEFTTRAGRPIRLFGYLSEATDEHLLIEAIEGSTTRPASGDSVSISALIGRSVQQASTTVLMGGDGSPRRLMLRRPLAFIGGNRRRHERVTARLPLTWFDVERGPASSRTGQTVDVSVGGAQLITSGEPAAAGDRIVAVLELPNRHVPVVCEVRSWRDDPGGARMGVEFMAIADLDRAALAHLTG
jgi:PilZ domain